MEVFFILTILLLTLYLGGTAATIRYLSGMRNGLSVVVAFASAYVFSIAFDNIWVAVVGNKAVNVTPVIGGILYGVGFFFPARRLATNPILVRSAYVVIGALALCAGILGHRHNLLVGASMLLLSVVLPFGDGALPQGLTLERVPKGQ
jgi:hypothetical protein